MTRPRARPDLIPLIDGRTSEARHMGAVRDALTQSTGGNPSPLQRILIEQAAVLALRIHLADVQYVRSGTEAPDYAEWLRALDRLLGRIANPNAPPETPCYDAGLAYAARSVVVRDDRGALDIRAEAARLAYGGPV
jgi:hypothetical protein